MILLIGLAVGVDYSMFYLRRKMEERDAGRILRSGARVRRRHVRQGGAGLRPHGDDRHGRHVPGRQRRLHLLRRRHDARRRRRDARQRHRPPRGALQARRQRREGPRARTSAGCATATTASRASGAGSSTSALARPVRLGDRRRRHPRRARAPRAEHEDGQPRRRRPAARPADHADLRAHPVRVPRRPAARRSPSSRPRTSPRPRCQKGIEELKATATGPTSVLVSPNKQVAIVSHPAPGQRHRRHAPTPRWCKLRDTTIPATIGRVAGTETNVTGMTAGSKDFNDKMNSRLPIVFAFVLGLAFLLLLVTFRSIVVPLKAIVLNLLSRRRGLRHPHVRLPGRPLREPARTSAPSAGSRPGCRCSCS